MPRNKVIYYLIYYTCVSILIIETINLWNHDDYSIFDECEKIKGSLYFILSFLRWNRFWWHKNYIKHLKDCLISLKIVSICLYWKGVILSLTIDFNFSRYSTCIFEGSKAASTFTCKIMPLFWHITKSTLLKSCTKFRW